MTPSFFKPEDFTSCAFYEITRDKIVANPSLLANVCNLILAERGVRVFVDKEENGWHAGECNNAGKTHTALLIAIEPIKAPDTAESLLRELCQWASESNIIEYTGSKPPNTLDMYSIIGRARALLGGDR